MSKKVEFYIYNTMFSNILINKRNLINNIIYLKSHSQGKLCLMVKANAYGHGDKEIVEIASDYVDFFGVSNMREALSVRGSTDKPIIVFGGCEDYAKCIENDISFALFSFDQTKEIIKICKASNGKPRMHLCVNSGMNRYGVREISECKKIIALLQKNNIELEGLYTHFSSLTTDSAYTQKQIERFEDFRALIPKEWNTIVHVGGGRSIFEGYHVDMNRVGLYAYGYGDEMLNPVMKVTSQIVDIVDVKKGEHVGYLCGFTAPKNMTVATIPLGYGDGFPRKLSNKLEVEINGKKVKNVGNICMDAFMVDVSKLRCKVGDSVTIFENASLLAPLIESTEYEVLTNMTKFRGDKKII
ncbi:MAG: alanine racemase [Clostridia bacterium]|nr:alanine racemase [Clostridia bacterium]